jgi:hypothetical protein
MNASVSVMPLDSSAVQSNPRILDSLPNPPIEGQGVHAELGYKLT